MKKTETKDMLQLLKENAVQMNDICNQTMNDFNARQKGYLNSSSKINVLDGNKVEQALIGNNFMNTLSEKINETMENIKIDAINIKQADMLAREINDSCVQSRNINNNDKKLPSVYQNMRTSIDENTLPIFRQLHRQVLKPEDIPEQYKIDDTTFRRSFYYPILTMYINAYLQKLITKIQQLKQKETRRQQEETEIQQIEKAIKQLKERKETETHRRHTLHDLLQQKDEKQPSLLSRVNDKLNMLQTKEDILKVYNRYRYNTDKPIKKLSAEELQLVDKALDNYIQQNISMKKKLQAFGAGKIHDYLRDNVEFYQEAIQNGNEKARSVMPAVTALVAEKLQNTQLQKNLLEKYVKTLEEYQIHQKMQQEMQELDNKITLRNDLIDKFTERLSVITDIQKNNAQIAQLTEKKQNAQLQMEKLEQQWEDLVKPSKTALENAVSELKIYKDSTSATSIKTLTKTQRDYVDDKLNNFLNEKFDKQSINDFYGKLYLLACDISYDTRSNGIGEINVQTTLSYFYNILNEKLNKAKDVEPEITKWKDEVNKCESELQVCNDKAQKLNKKNQALQALKSQKPQRRPVPTGAQEQQTNQNQTNNRQEAPTGAQVRQTNQNQANNRQQPVQQNQTNNRRQPGRFRRMINGISGFFKNMFGSSRRNIQHTAQISLNHIHKQKGRGY